MGAGCCSEYEESGAADWCGLLASDDAAIGELLNGPNVGTAVPGFDDERVRISPRIFRDHDQLPLRGRVWRVIHDGANDGRATIGEADAVTDTELPRPVVLRISRPLTHAANHT